MWFFQKPGVQPSSPGGVVVDVVDDVVVDELVVEDDVVVDDEVVVDGVVVDGVDGDVEELELVELEDVVGAGCSQRTTPRGNGTGMTV